jgi:hypothetical protein
LLSARGTLPSVTKEKKKMTDGNKFEITAEKLFYSKSAGGFYSSYIHDTMPYDVVEISKEEHAALLEGQGKGQVIASDNKGRPVLQAPPAPTPEQLQEQVNAKARAYLYQTDW